MCLTARAAHLAIETLERRLIHGAQIQDGELYFDRELKMVRSRKRKASGSVRGKKGKDSKEGGT